MFTGCVQTVKLRFENHLGGAVRGRLESELKLVKSKKTTLRVAFYS